MNLTKHTLLGIGAGAIFYPFFGINTVWFLISSILIDIDHFISFICITGFANFNLKTMFIYYDTLLSWKHRNDMLGLCFFHTFEFLGLAISAVFILKSQAVLMFCGGSIFHFLCDSIFLLKRGMLSKRANSFLEYFIRRHNMIKSGIDVKQIFTDALEVARSS